MAKKRKLITRRRMKWTGTSLAALLIVVFVLSGKYASRVESRATYGPGLRYILVGGGQLHLQEMAKRNKADTRRKVHWVFGEIDPYRLEWGWEWESKRTVGFHFRTLSIPLWFPLLLIAAPTAWLWRTDRRAKPWQCDNCRYDLRGIGSAVCPECGETTE